MNQPNVGGANRVNGEQLTERRKPLSRIPPAAIGQLFRASEVTCALLLVALTVGCGQESAIPARQVINRPGALNRNADAPTAKLVTIAQTVRASRSTAQRRSATLDANLRQLQTAIVRRVKGDEVSPPPIFAANFSARAIDRERFQIRFDGTPFAVERWSHAESAPTLSLSPTIIDQLAQSIYRPWQGSENFRLELKLFTSNDGDDLVLATAFGDIDQQSSRQATSLWVTRWSPPNDRNSDRPNAPATSENEFRELQLSKLKVVAQEEVLVRTPGGRLMQDYTASILQGCDVFAKQLQYSVDDWARRIPGVDIMGQHGIAVGDVNGDGLDDLYVCQPHGLPNVLLVQKPDGTVHDLSAAMKVDVLDDSRAALLVDLDNDLDQDLVVATDETLLLFSQADDNTFQLEHRLTIGRSTHSLSAADFDQDGDLDLFLCKYEGTRHRDDLIVFPKDFTQANDGGHNVLLRNDEGWQFTDATVEAGITDGNSQFSRSAIWSDIDLDGDQDLYITNEFASDQLYRNDNGRLHDITVKAGLASVARHRSVSCGDFNQDGRSDFFVATDVPASAMRGMGDPARENASIDPRVSLTGDSQVWYAGEQTSSRPDDQGMAWRPFAMRAPMYSAESAFGSLAVDLNNDGFDDIVVSNGQLTRRMPTPVDDGLYERLFVARRPTDEQRGIAFQTDGRRIAKMIRETTDLCRAGYSFAGSQRNQCYLSIGRMGFASVGPTAGLDSMLDGRAVATTDWDNDGDSDLVLTNRNGPQLRILCNQLNGQNHFVSFRLVGTQSNADAVGAQVAVYIAGQQQPSVKTVRAGSGYLAQSSKQLLFGLGQRDHVEKVGVTWPNGQQQTFSDIGVDTSYQLVEGTPVATENRPERLNLSIKPQAAYASEMLPSVTRALFNPPGLVPQLAIVESDGRAYPAIGSDLKTPTLLIFCDNQPASRQLVQSVTSQSKEWTATTLDCVLAIVDSTTDGKATDLSYAQQMMRHVSFPFPFRWGTLNAVSQQRLKFWSGNYLDNHQLPPLPFAVLVNRDGNASVFYPSTSIAQADFGADCQLAIESAEQHWNSVMPRPGRWLAPYRFSSADRMIKRLSDLDDQAAAKKLNESSGPIRAYELFLRGQEFQSTGELPTASSFFDRALKLDPRSAVARLGTAQVLRTQANELAAINVANAGQTKLRKRAIENFEIALELDPDNNEAILGRAHTTIDQQRLPKAIEFLKRHVKLQPDNYQIQAIVGRLLFHERQYEEAENWLVSAFDHHPTLPSVAGDLGFLYLTVGQFEQAVRFLSLAHRLQPSDQNIQQLQAELFYLTGDHRNCLTKCQALLDLDPNRQRPKYILAWLSATSPDEKVLDAQRALTIMTPSADTFDTRSASALEIYAAALAQDRQFEKAADVQRQAVQLVESGTNQDAYSSSQREGMKSRLELYERQQPYRTQEPELTPLGVPNAVWVNRPSGSRE